MSASRPGFLPGHTEVGAGQEMDSKRKLQAAGMSFKADAKASAYGRQVGRQRQQSQASREQAQANARKQALLEMIYAHSVLGIPLEGLAAATDMGVDFGALPGPGMAGDNLTMQPPQGQPLAGSFGM